MADLVIGTAGHVDHGKSSLVLALTGQNPDRLPEEQRRGLTIDLGFAQFQLPSGRRAALVDVPGHERFIKNMVAGASGIDLVLLVIAADEGVMPQTREHLDIVQLLGIKHGIVVLTKIDLVDDEWLELVEEEIREQLQGTPFAGAPLVRVSNVTGEGLDQLLETLDQLIPHVPPRRQDAYPRLHIDRVFTVAGFGTVVTGTLVAGRIEVGQQLEIQPTGLPVRVRQIQVHGRTVEIAVAGQRVALNLTGIDRESVHRGHVLVAPGSLRPVRLFAGVMELLPHAVQGIKSGARLRIHTGTSEIIGRCLLLDRDQLEPGERCYMLFRAESDMVVARGDRFIVRSYSPMHTIGGGTVLDPGRRYRRFRPESIEQLSVLEGGDIEQMVQLVLVRAGEPLPARRIATELGLTPEAVDRALETMLDRDAIIRIGGTFYVHRHVYNSMLARVTSLLEAHHHKFPLRPGMSREELRSELAPGLDGKAFTDLLDKLMRDGALVVSGEVARRPDFQPKLNAAQEAALQKMEEHYQQAGSTPATLSELVQQLGMKPVEVRALADILVERGRVVRVSDELYLAAPVYDDLVTAICRRIFQEGPQTVAQIRDLLGTTRKYVVPLLEHLDQVQLTRRAGDRRELTQRGRERSLNAGAP